MFDLRKELHDIGSCYIAFSSGHINISPWTVLEKPVGNLQDILLGSVKELTGLPDNVLEIALNESQSLTQFIDEINTLWEQQVNEYEI